MSLPIFFEENMPAPGSSFGLSEETSKHCIQVLRMRTGEQLALADGNGSLYTAAIAQQDKRSCVVTIQAVESIPKPVRHITIAISLLKNASRFEWFLEKAVEIGVNEIIPLLSARTEKQHFRHDRMQNIVVSAMLQSGQAWLPKLHQPTAFEKAVLHQAEQKLIAHCAEGEKQPLATVRPGNNIVTFIGPEGDFTSGEIQAALSQGFVPVSLGSTRLRTETAGIVASALLAR